MSEPEALLNILPHAGTAVRKQSSLCLYHFERGNNAPSHSVRIRTRNSPVRTHWKKRGFANPREEARQKSPNEVAGDSGQDGDWTPEGSCKREVDGGLLSMTEEHIPIPHGAKVSKKVRRRLEIKGVRRNLHGDVSDVENT